MRPLRLFASGPTTRLALAVALATGCGSRGASPPAAPRSGTDTGSRVLEDDRDADRIRDSRDGCVDAAEDQDGFEDADGCPDDDDDRDGLADADDLCPREAEDADGLDDADGCPDDDVDRDRIDDADDACPREAETYDGHDDGDGCPDFALVHADGDELFVIERIRFERGTSRVHRYDARLVAALVAVLAREARFRTIALDGIVGEGDERSARRRADSLRRSLVRGGIDPARLVVRVFQEPREPDVTHDDGTDTVEVTVLDPPDPLARWPRL